MNSRPALFPLGGLVVWEETFPNTSTWSVERLALQS